MFRSQKIKPLIEKYSAAKTVSNNFDYNWINWILQAYNLLNNIYF